MKPLIDVAWEAANLAGKTLMSSYGKLSRSQISVKSKNDFVTEIDKKSEKIIISTIKKYFPGHAIQGEESGISTGKNTLWIIDPLDGTSNYIHSIPVFSVSIGILRDNKLRAGLIYDPVHHEVFRAEEGRGAYLNN